MNWQEAGILLAFLLGVWNLIHNYRISKRTTFVNTVTSERIKWIQNTREAIATLCGRTYYWVMTQDEIDQQESNQIRKDIDRLRLLAKLQLNPKADKDNDIMVLIDKMFDYTDKIHEAEMKQLLQNIVTKTQFMLKEEWDKVRDESIHGDLREKRKFLRI